MEALPAEQSIMGIDSSALLLWCWTPSLPLLATQLLLRCKSVFPQVCLAILHLVMLYNVELGMKCAYVKHCGMKERCH